MSVLSLVSGEPLLRALTGGLVAMLLVGLGAWMPRHLLAWSRWLLALVAGAFLLTAVFALGLPAAQHLAAQGDFLATVLPLAAGILLGAGGGQALARGLDSLQAGSWGTPVRRAVLVLALHNLPEGLALGAGLSVGNPLQGLGVLGGIGLHNLLEGACLAALLRRDAPKGLVALALLAAVTEPIGALVGAKLASGSPAALPWVLMITAGALIEIVRAEVLPELRRSRKSGEDPAACCGPR